jgi:3-methyladenine DNA glycosylase AlkD
VLPRSKFTAKDVIAWLKRTGTARTRDGMARYALPTDRAFGVPVGTMRAEAKRIGMDHELAAALWKSGWYEARMMAALVDDPRLVTRKQMDAWARDFEDWGICDTACFHLFSRTPFAWDGARRWAKSPREFVKRGAFAMMASLVLRDKNAPDDGFLALLPLIEKGAEDDRNFVKKAVNWALRTIGKKNAAMNAAAIATAKRLAASEDAAPRWVGKDALRELAGPAVQGRLARRAVRPTDTGPNDKGPRPRASRGTRG